MTSIDATHDPATDTARFVFARAAGDSAVLLPIFGKAFLNLNDRGVLLAREIPQASKFVSDAVRDACRTIRTPGEKPPADHSGMPVRVTFDATNNVAYLYFDPSRSGQRSLQQAVAQAAGSTFVIDFDKHRRIIGIEVLGARNALEPALLQ